MKGLVNKSTNILEEIVEDLSGYDLTIYNVIDIEDDPVDVIWENNTISRRPETPNKRLKRRLTEKPFWNIFKESNVDELEAWLDSNMNNMQNAREIIKTIVLFLKVKGVK
jgi:hypothetical protein